MSLGDTAGYHTMINHQTSHRLRQKQPQPVQMRQEPDEEQEQRSFVWRIRLLCNDVMFKMVSKTFKIKLHTLCTASLRRTNISLSNGVVRFHNYQRSQRRNKTILFESIMNLVQQSQLNWAKKNYRERDIQGLFVELFNLFGIVDSLALLQHVLDGQISPNLFEWKLLFGFLFNNWN